MNEKRNPQSMNAHRCASLGTHGCTTAATAAVLLSTTVNSEAAIQYTAVNITVSAGTHYPTFETLGLGNIKLYANTVGGGGTSKCTMHVGHGVSTSMAGTNPDVTRLNYGDSINGALGFNANAARLYYANTNSGTTHGNFTSEGYVGFRFNDNGIKYGWIHVSNIDTESFTIDGYAYEASGGSIQAGDQGSEGTVPEPNGLALLACGAAGIYALRKQRK